VQIALPRMVLGKPRCTVSFNDLLGMASPAVQV